MKVIKHPADLDVDGRTILKWKLKEKDAAWIGLKQVRLVIGGGPFWIL